jgi:hypothetical protein
MSFNLNDNRVISHGQNTSHQVSLIMVEVLSRVPQGCPHDFSLAGLPDRWKEFWSEKFCLLWLQLEGNEWSVIVQWFKERGIDKGRDALRRIWTRVSKEVSGLL